MPNILASQYQAVYLIFVTIITIYCIYKYSFYPEDRVFSCNKSGLLIPSLIITIAMILFIGLRPLSGVFVDMMNYAESYYALQDWGASFEFNEKSVNFLFDNYYKYLATNYYDIAVFFFSIALVYFGCMCLAIKKIFPHDTLYALIIYLGAFSTFTYGTNGIKAGAAASIFLLAFAFYKKPLIAALFCILSLGFHHSMIIVIYAFILAWLIKNPKWFFFGWLGCLFLSLFHLTAVTDFLAQYADEGGQQYLLADENDWGGKAGFRWDFILYSLPPIAIGFWTVYKHHKIDRLYQLLLCTYLTVNGLWMLCMYIPYNNRIAYLSWFILPVVTVYPFFKLKIDTRQYIQLNYVVTIYLAFTLFAALFIK